MLGKQGGWALELQGMFLFTALALMFMSPGRYASPGDLSAPVLAGLRLSLAVPRLRRELLGLLRDRSPPCRALRRPSR